MLEAKNITKTYTMGDILVNALNDISLKVNEGDMICISGKSGSGKSTLLHQLGLLDYPTHGEIYLNGEEVTRLSDTARSYLRLSYLGYVFQEFALLGELTAYENVCLPAMMLGDSTVSYEKRAKELLDLVGLGDRCRHRPRELSGGQQQRVAIARALVNAPKLLFADEPCANLDTTASKLVMETLVTLNKDLNLTVIFVSHEPEDARYANRSVVLSDGKIMSNSENA